MVTQSTGRKPRTQAATGKDLFMADDDAAKSSDDGTLFPQSVGERLRAARVAANLDLNDVATKTRVPMRHLEAIERGDYAALPSSTYAIGFARSFARAIGVDDASIAREVRAELGRAPPEDGPYAPYEPVDPARLPSRLLAWTTAIIAIVLLGGYLAWRAEWFSTKIEAPSDVAPAVVTAPPVAPSAASTDAAQTPLLTPMTGAVVLTATSPVWLRIYDKADKVLLERELAPGEAFTVPPETDTPMVRTGRAEAIRVTVGGREVAPLGPPERTVRDVVLTAAALEARAVSPTAAPATVPAPLMPNAVPKS